MNFIEYANSWSRTEVLQGRIMISIGILLTIALVVIVRSEHELLKGLLIPLSLLLMILIGYGGYILYSRPAHVKESIERYQNFAEEAVLSEKNKHINDNKVGKALLRYVYPLLMLVSVVVLVIVPTPYYKGMALGFIFLCASTYIIDYGFVSRSDDFISFLDNLN